jgi:glucose/arabinose dehydrogenase
VRHLVVSEGGDIYVSLRNVRWGDPPHGTVALRDTDADGRADVEVRFGAIAGTGIDLKGDFLYLSSSREVVRFGIRSGELIPRKPAEVVISGLPDVEGAQSPARPFAFDDRGSIFVHVAAPSNTCEGVPPSASHPLPDPCRELDRHAGVWRFDGKRRGQIFEDGERFATGIRSSVGMRWHQGTRTLYMVNHGRDGLDHQHRADIFSRESDHRLPSDELLSVFKGSDFGWPYCYHDPLQRLRLLAPEYGGDGRRIGRCADTALPLVAFPAHSAPNDLLFYEGTQFPARYRDGVFVAFHGGVTRPGDEQLAYRVVFIPFAGGNPGPWEIFAEGFSGPAPVHNPNNAVHRPVGLAEGPDGSLYIADSRKGRIWRIVYAADKTSQLH